MRRETAEKWSEEHNLNLSPEDINCDGCKSGEELCSYCDICEVRACAMEKGVENCAHCDEYPCKKLKGFHELQEAKETLEEINSNL